MVMTSLRRNTID